VGLLIVMSGLAELLTDPRLTGAMLVVTGFVLWMGEPCVESRHETGNIETLSNQQAFWIGIAQAFAIVPGLSRSGLTIVVARRIGLHGQQAAQFSFLMSIPVIAGAVVVMLSRQLLSSESAGATDIAWNVVGLGIAVAAIVGYGALRALLVVLEKGRFHWFTFWCIPLGVFLLVFTY
jgi:undecaprenyl-diphosphatase